MPIWWLGDAATWPRLASQAERFWIRDGRRDDSPVHALAGMPSAGRARVEDAVREARENYVAGLNLELLPVQTTLTYHRQT